MRLSPYSFHQIRQVQRFPEIGMGHSYSFGRVSVHEALGGESVADVLLWRNFSGAVVVIITATTVWYLFEYAGYNLLIFIANTLFLLVVVLFFWARSASLLNRPLPQLPNMEISEQSAVEIAKELEVLVNNVLLKAHDIAVGKNLKLLIRVILSLWVVAYIGSLFDFITLLYIGILLCLSLPVLYETFQDYVGDKLDVVFRVIQCLVGIIDNILINVPLPSAKRKKYD